VAAHTPSRSTVPWRRAIIWAFPVVVICFLTQMVISQIIASAIDDAATRIVTDYSPSVVALASARAELHRIQDLASDYVDGGGRPADLARVQAADADLDQAVKAYLRLPTQRGEQELWGRVDDDIVSVRRTLDHVRAAVGRSDRATARALVAGDLRAGVDRASAAILTDIELNGAFAETDARAIAHHRRRSLEAAVVLSIASVAFTAMVALLVLRLITQHDDLQRRHAALLEETNAELETFASRLAHDVLSPLASTRLALDAALNGEREEGMQRVLQRGANALTRVTRLVRALFEFARAGARPSSGESGDVQAVVNGVLEELRPVADETGTALGASLPAPRLVACNEGLLTAALSNLVRNALTHMDGAPNKHVDIIAADDGDRVRIEVRDDGPGLPPGSEATVFDPFVRGPGATSSGLGLGLATVKRIVESHGGAVGVESHAGVGCRFWMALPKAHATTV
jgi:signal transduction histidine kinase